MFFYLLDGQTIYPQERTNPINHHKRPSRVYQASKSQISPKTQRFSLRRKNRVTMSIMESEKIHFCVYGEIDDCGEEHERNQ